MPEHNTLSNADKVILDLCGGTGSWSKPYKDAGYDVRLVTLPEYDVRIYIPPANVYGILAAPPCTYFCRMRRCRGRPTNEQFAEGLSVIDACLRIIWRSKPAFWALENPEGYLKDWLGDPVYAFQPYEFGHDYSKNTWLWGNFNPPFKRFTYSPHKKRVICNLTGKNRQEKRAITPANFARAFFEANR